MVPVMDPSLSVRFCEYATVHRDGTFSVVRGGIDVWQAEALPVSINVSVLVEIPPGTLPAGRHALRFAMSSGAGTRILEASAEMAIPDPSKSVPLAVSLAMTIDAPGTALLIVECGPAAGMATLEVSVVE